MQIFDDSRSPAGIGFVGIKRVDVASEVRGKSLYSGFKGYVKKDSLNKGLIYILMDHGCILTSKIPTEVR